MQAYGTPDIDLQAVDTHRHSERGEQSLRMVTTLCWLYHGGFTRSAQTREQDGRLDLSRRRRRIIPEGSETYSRKHCDGQMTGIGFETGSHIA